MKKITYKERATFYIQEVKKDYKKIKLLKAIKDKYDITSMALCPCASGVYLRECSEIFKESYFIDIEKTMINIINNQKEQQSKKNVKTYICDMKNINEILEKSGFQRWYMEQTKESRFMPNLSSDNVQIGIIFDSDNEYIKNLLVNDILSGNMDNEVLKDFVVDKYYDRFLIDIKNKDDFFTDRESAVLFGIPSNFIEGILVGRTYENDEEMLNNIKGLLPNVYICNLDGIVIK